MEKVLAENRRLQLLCEKMRSENHTQPTATAHDFFSLDESQLDVSKNHHDKRLKKGGESEDAVTHWRRD